MRIKRNNNKNNKNNKKIFIKKKRAYINKHLLPYRNLKINFFTGLKHFI